MASSSQARRNKSWPAGWIALGLVLASLASTLLWNIERSIFGKEPTASWDSLLTASTSVANVMATAGFLWATYRLLKETERSSNLTRALTMRLHADSLTPFITIASIQHDLHLTSHSNPTLVVRDVDITRGPGVLVNNGVRMDVEQLRLSGTVSIGVTNYAAFAAEVFITLSIDGQKYSSDAFLAGGGALDKRFSLDIDMQDSAEIQRLLGGNDYLGVVVRARGPGASADEITTTQARLCLNTSSEAPLVLIHGADMDITRSRIYSRVIGYNDDDI